MAARRRTTAGGAGSGNAYIIEIAGTQMGSAAQAGGQCALETGVIDLSCLNVSTDAQATAAEVLGLVIGGGAGEVTGFRAVAAPGGRNGGGEPGPTPRVKGREIEPGVGGTLPFTGSATAGLVALTLALALLAVGWGLAARRPTGQRSMSPRMK